MKNVNIKPSEEVKKDIIDDFINELKIITPLRGEIRKLSQHACQLLSLYNDNIFPDLLESIIKEANKNNKIDFLYLIIDIILILLMNEEYNSIKEETIKIIFPYFKNVCRTFHYSLNDNDINEVKKALNHLKNNKIYTADIIDELIYELNMTTEPNIMGDNNDKKYISILMSKKILKVSEDIINLSEIIDNYNEKKNNENRLELIKKENDIIKKQLDEYDKNLQQINYLNKLIQKCENNQ